MRCLRLLATAIILSFSIALSIVGDCHADLKYTVHATVPAFSTVIVNSSGKVIKILSNSYARTPNFVVRLNSEIGVLLAPSTNIIDQYNSLNTKGLNYRPGVIYTLSNQTKSTQINLVPTLLRHFDIGLITTIKP